MVGLFWADRAFAYKLDTGRVIRRPKGWNLAVELEAPHHTTPTANLSQEHHDKGTAFGTHGESRTHDRTASCNQTDVNWTTVWQGTDLQDQTNGHWNL